ncbi:hypothetical protein Lser_V15G17366 [Lactuca serriola]
MSGLDNNDLPKSQGNDVLQLIHGNHTSLPPPPPIILPNPQARRLEKFKITQTLLAMKHKDGSPVYTHVLGMKSQIDRLRMLGVDVPRNLAIDWVLQSLPESYNVFINDYYVTDYDMTLIDLSYSLIAAESEMMWRNSQANMEGRSISQTCMDMGNGNIGCPENLSLPNRKGSALVNPVNRKVRRKFKSRIACCTIPKESICFHCKEKGHSMRSYPSYLKDLKETGIKMFESALDVWQNQAKGRELKEYAESDCEDGFLPHG